MRTFIQMAILYTFCLFSFLCSFQNANSQENRSTANAMPAELTAIDPEIRDLLGNEKDSCKSSNIDALKNRIEKASQIADSRGLVRDRALIEAALGSLLIGGANVDMAFLSFQKALQDSIDTKNEILEADILNSLAYEAELKGNNEKSLELLERALTLANKNSSLYEKTKTLGAMGRLELLKGKKDEARNHIDEALSIDRLNGYQAEALHSVYKAYYLGLTGDDTKAMDLLVQAKSKAIVDRNAFVFLLAENAYAFALVRKGKVDEAILELELIKSGNLQTLVHEPNERECISNALGLPILRIALLEGITNALEAANLKEKELQTWRELLTVSHSVGLLAGEAEARLKVANLENQLKRTQEAIQDYAIAADLYRSLGNDSLVNQAEIDQTVLLVNSGRGVEAVPLAKQIAARAERLNHRELEFRAYLTLGGIYQGAGQLGEARDALERATSLVHPGPFDEEIEDKTVHQAYVSLAEIYGKLQIPRKELLAIDQAFFVSLHLKDEDAKRREVIYLDQRLNELHVRNLLDQWQKEGRLGESLLYSYILYLRDGTKNNLISEDSNWSRILSLPFQMVEKPAGAIELDEILKGIGPILGLEKLPMLNALGRYYVGPGSDPILAEKYSLEADTVLASLKGDQSGLKVESTCVLSLSYARQNKVLAAQNKSAECLSFAEKTHDAQLITYSQAVDSMVQAQTGNIAAAKSSLERLIAKAPQNPVLLVELAASLAGAKLYNESNLQLHSAVSKFLATDNRRTAAGAYERVAAVLNSDSTAAAKKLQLEYLKAALKLYHEIGQPEEANTLILLGDYFLRINQSRPAIENYQAANELAERTEQKNVIGQSLLGLGNAYQAQKDFVKATQAHNSACDIFRELGNSVGETISLRGVAQDYYELNDPDKALAALLGAYNTANTAGAFHRYLAAYLLGEFYRSQGEYEKSLASFRDAVEITEKAGDTEHCAYSHLALAGAEAFVGAWEDSLAESNSALTLFQKTGSREGQGLCWAHLTAVYSDRTSALKNFDKAKECYQKALELGYGKSLELELMEIYLQTGKFDEAAKIARTELHDCLVKKDDNCRANVLISLSEAERLRGELKASRLALSEAGPLVTKSPDLYLKGRLEYQRSRLLTSEGKFDEALRSYKQLISLIENIKGKLDAQEQKSLSENYGFIYDELVALLYSMSNRRSDQQSSLASESLRYAEINKARQFAASWGRVFVNQMRQTLPPASQERERSLNFRRDGLLAKLEAGTDTGELTQKGEKEKVLADLSSVQGEIKQFVSDLRNMSPQYAAIAYPEEIHISSIPLRKGETLVEFKMTEDSTFAWIIQNKDGSQNSLVAFYRILKRRDWFLDRLSVLRKGLNSGQAGGIDLKVSQELFAELFPGDVTRMVLESQDLIFVPDDVLFILPFELLSPSAAKGEFVLLKKATTYYPSAVSLRLARTAAHQSSWQETFLGIADPITSSEDDRFGAAGALKYPENLSSNQIQTSEDEKSSSNPDRLKSRGFSFERLPGTASEVQSIVSLLKARHETVEVRSGASATKAELLDTDLSKFRFVHFATHGVLPVDTGIKEPSLVLSYDGVASSHMFLSMSEIIGLKLHSESVVLSACNTGSGKISRAEGVMSLGRAFLAAGSASVTVSLWQVSDESTAVLMKSYYGALLAGKKKGAALAEARQAVFASGSKDPFFWAPFVVIGE
jgi:CHAT domain-containing protein/tetratricopeptide (TPR) repeat protein